MMAPRSHWDIDTTDEREMWRLSTWKCALGHTQTTDGKYAEDEMREVCVVTTFLRQELFYCCLKRIREFEPDIQIEVFPDRSTIHDPIVQQIIQKFGAHGHLVPDNSWYGNSANAMNCLLWAYNAGFDRVFYIESDVMVHKEFFSWHRYVQEEYPDVFCSMAWVFNRHAPITNDELFQAWFYAPGVSFTRENLELVVEHATPLYFEDMPGYVGKNFKDSPLNDPLNLNHWEFDGLIQRIIDKNNRQTVSSGIAKCSHVGFVRSYGDTGAAAGYEEMFQGVYGGFDARVKKIEEFIADPYARAEYFGRDIVEREIGRELPERKFQYRVTLPGGWESTFTSQLSRGMLPKRINSVPLPDGAVIERV